MKVISEYIAPWALPNEEIPVHLVWEPGPGFEYDRIQIHVPPEIAIKEFFNVESYEQKNSIVSINALKTPSFFGFVVSLVKTFENQHEKKKIKIELISNNQVKYSHVFTANIYRPRLTLVESPKSLVLTDDTDLRKLVNISLKISGFGRIHIRTEISTGGEFVSRAEPLYHEMVRKIISTFKLGEPSKEEKGIVIDPKYIQETAKSFIEKLEKGEFPLDVDKEDLEEFRIWIEEEGTRKKFVDLVSRHLENLLIDSLLFYFDRHPIDNVELIQGKPITLIESATRVLRLRFRYRDSMKNEYQPILVNMPIDDRRKKETQKRRIELPININWRIETISPIEESA